MSALHGLVGRVTIATTNNRGFTVEELADRALDRIILVGEDVPAPIKEQALAYRESIRGILIFYMREAIDSHNTTVENRLADRGYADLAVLLKP